MKKIHVLYTGFGTLITDYEKYLKEYCEDVEITKKADEGLIRDCIRSDGITPEIMRRCFHDFEDMQDAGADLILCACSSIGGAALASRQFLSVPVIRIDEAMIRRALHISPRIGVLASLKTTMTPTTDYVQEIARESGVVARVQGAVAEGAYAANKAGDSEKHDELIVQAAQEMKNCVDVIILAQGSMARVEERVAQETGIPVLSSPRLSAQAVGEFIRSR